MGFKKNILPFLIWGGLLILLALFDIFRGLGTPSSVSAENLMILKMVRIPRVLTAIIAGGGLAVAGAQMQSILRNPLADPHIMGISSGASLGAAIATLVGEGTVISEGILHGSSVAVSATLGAAVAAVIIMSASVKFRRASTLLVFGVMLSFIINAVVTVLQSSSNAENLKIFHSWSAGNFGTTSSKEIILLSSTLLIAILLAFTNRAGLDIILFGDEFAKLAGAKPERIRISALLSCCLITGTVTAFCGPIGFVGIVAPHIARSIWKTSAHKMIIPGSLMCGSIIGLTADLISQMTPAPIPVSSTMAVAGIPIIIYILIKRPEYR